MSAPIAMSPLGRKPITVTLAELIHLHEELAKWSAATFARSPDSRYSSEEWHKAAIELLKRLQTDPIAWLQASTTLHRQVEISYVVDGYEVEITRDGVPIGPANCCRADTVLEALQLAAAKYDPQTGQFRNG